MKYIQKNSTSSVVDLGYALWAMPQVYSPGGSGPEFTAKAKTILLNEKAPLEARLDAVNGALREVQALQAEELEETSLKNLLTLAQEGNVVAAIYLRKVILGWKEQA
jgi:hypothetical protein